MVGPRQAYLAQLAVPFLHLAWMRTQINGAADGDRLEPKGKSVLTSREQEILRWIYLGKSNGERIILTEWSPAADAKNRHNLPDEIPMGCSAKEAWTNFIDAVKSGKQQTQENK